MGSFDSWDLLLTLIITIFSVGVGGLYSIIRIRMKYSIEHDKRKSEKINKQDELLCECKKLINNLIAEVPDKLTVKQLLKEFDIKCDKIKGGENKNVKQDLELN